ncbi:Cupin domain protein [Aspergillus candidus]|uniref:CENP-C homolog n=1 Tax=Aspergillus candidus TaxID=41067 RepID=A0A2I2FF05_ASPCN|nr:hypothetical protein BDW47DRAFT_103859 [Aspergillus candidus]PLB39214.1 hypothetical protein BDW47DRAFT_103859 [Aspergillus candidus]
MAPRGSLKPREYDFSNVGKAGRRTGLTLKEGKRDEYGMEEIEGMWSSPEKSPIGENDFDSRHDVSDGSDGMSIDEGNGPAPADYLNGLNSRRSPFFPPPVARSPVKTGLSGSPRRTPGLRSSQSPQRDIPSSSPSDGKGHGNVRGDSRPDVSPLTNRSVNAPSLNQVNNKRNKANAKELAAAVYFSDSDANSPLNGDENAGVIDHVQEDFSNSIDGGDETMLSDHMEDPDRNREDEEPLSPEAPNRNEEQAPDTTIKTRRNPQNKKNKAQDTAQQNKPEAEQSTKRKRPGRPPKSQSTGDADVEGQRASKMAKPSSKRSREPEASGNPELDKVVENYVSRTGPLKGRSLHILKREAPSESGATHTRSGRVSVRPLAYWRNERCVYGDGDASEGQRYPLSTIKEVIRTEEPETGAEKRGSKKSKSKKKRNQADSDDDAEYADDWEKDAGVLHGFIRKWDPETQTATEDDEVLDIAYAPVGIETRDVKGSKFRFAKLLSSSFLGSGIVELPPGGIKKPKNSKKMHMVFYVVSGRVQIDISGVQFSAGKGCVFQVPRGNYYSFANTHAKDTRLFFTQSCVPTESESEGAEPDPESASKFGNIEDEAATPTERPAKGGKGRPKKQKGKAGGAKAGTKAGTKAGSKASKS